METRRFSHLCTSCGKTSVLDVHVDEGMAVNSEYPRECLHCKKLETYLVTPIRNYRVNVFGLVQRIRLLEKRVKELESK